VVKVDVRVTEKCGRLRLLILERLVVRVVENEFAGLMINVVLQIEVLVAVHNFGELLVTHEGVLFGSQLLCKPILHVLEQRLNTFGKSTEFYDTGRKSFTLANLELVLVAPGSLPNALIPLSVSHRHKLAKRRVDLHALRSGEDSKLGRLNDEGEASGFPHESLKVIGTVLDKGEVLVSKSLLWWNSGNRDAGPSLAERNVKLIELRIAAFAFPDSLAVFTLAFVHNVPTVVLWVLNVEFFLVVIHEQAGALFKDFRGDFDLLCVHL
jgi:hypothetical protein